MNFYNNHPVNISTEGQFANPEKIALVRVIFGPMFSGKTKTLLKFITNYESHKKTVLVFKPIIDVRYSTDNIVSHDQEFKKAIKIAQSSQILDYISQADVFAIDEIQFFDSAIVAVCELIAKSGKIVLTSGLDLDYKMQPFSAMRQLLTIADEIIKLKSKCTVCGGHARFTHRLTTEEKTIILGEKDKYTALCRTCYHNSTEYQHSESLPA